MKKKLLLFLLATCMSLMLPLLADAQLQSEAQAWDLIFPLVERNTGYDERQLEKQQIEYEAGVWAFSLLISDHPTDEDGLLVGQIDQAGNLLYLHGPEKISIDRQLEDSLKRCFNRYDCYLQLKEVHDTWKPVLQKLSEDQISEIYPSYIAVINLNMPSSDDAVISYDDAYEAALQYMAQQPGWSDKKARMFRLAISAYYIPEDIKKPVYFFYFEKHSLFEEAYSTERAMNKYRAELIEAFEGAPPYRFSLMVDANNGKLIETPVIDYHSEFHYLDFLIRTEKVIQVGKEVAP